MSKIQPGKFRTDDTDLCLVADWLFLMQNIHNQALSIFFISKIKFVVM